ncbi:hypothetical protein [Planobispora longispora]|uniref:Uncharacterized protein n=1 Tax=Planobispora longispora TaxID=28887 RepID=A0A8J3RPY7_9ACTN|nr:hypothetical protein [Planobispora longispora]GIH78081.1 hypothetical protein Plo01_45100 [Planobispora longispora]
MIGQAVGRDVTFVELTPEQAREHWKDTYPEEIVDWFPEMDADPADGGAGVRPRREHAHRAGVARAPARGGLPAGVSYPGMSVAAATGRMRMPSRS